MKSPCYRLINLLDKDKILLMKNGSESDGVFRTNFGWNMTNKAEGYPCEKLNRNIIICLPYQSQL